MTTRSIWLDSWASADFFTGEGKKISWGARTYFLPKKQQKRYYLPKKSRNILFLASLGRPGEWGKSPPFPHPCGRPWLDSTEISNIGVIILDYLFLFSLAKYLCTHCKWLRRGGIFLVCPFKLTIITKMQPPPVNSYHLFSFQFL